jgi:hypothetical protein
VLAHLDDRVRLLLGAEGLDSDCDCEDALRAR